MAPTRRATVRPVPLSSAARVRIEELDGDGSGDGDGDGVGADDDVAMEANEAAVIDPDSPTDPDGQMLRQVNESAERSVGTFCNVGAAHQSLKQVRDQVRHVSEKHRITKLPGNRGASYVMVVGPKQRGVHSRTVHWEVPRPLWKPAQINEYLHKVLRGDAPLGNVVFRTGMVGDRKKVKEVADGWNRINILDRFTNNETSISASERPRRIWFGPDLPKCAKEGDRVLPETTRDWLLAQEFVVEQWRCSRQEAARRAHDLNRARPTSKLEHLTWTLYCDTPNAGVVKALLEAHPWLAPPLGGTNQSQYFVADVAFFFSKDVSRFVSHNEVGLRAFMESEAQAETAASEEAHAALEAARPLLSGINARGRITNYKRLVMAVLTVWRELRVVNAASVTDAYRELSRKASYEEFIAYISAATHSAGRVAGEEEENAAAGAPVPVGGGA